MSNSKPKKSREYKFILDSNTSKARMGSVPTEPSKEKILVRSEPILFQDNGYYEEKLSFDKFLLQIEQICKKFNLEHSLLTLVHEIYSEGCNGLCVEFNELVEKNKETYEKEYTKYVQNLERYKEEQELLPELKRQWTEREKKEKTSQLSDLLKRVEKLKKELGEK